MITSFGVKTLASLIAGLFLVLLLGTSAEAKTWDYSVTVDESTKVHPGMRPDRVHRVLKARPLYADSVVRRGEWYLVEVYTGYHGPKEFGVVYRIRPTGRVVVMTAWKNLL